MRRIYPPSGRNTRQSDCVESIEPALAQLVDRAQEAGWAREETYRAIQILASETLRSREAAAQAAA